jgi:tRNA pseudouridine55 synthase
MASGVLLLCLGAATRLVEYLEVLPKRYEAVAEFGVVTTTQDVTGAEISVHDARMLEQSAVERALSDFRGEIRQTPPMVSAVKHQGRRLYELARAGQEVERAARCISVYELELHDFIAGERPRARIEVLCSSGTYVRTLIHDLGAALGCGAAMASLVRTAIGGFSLDRALTLEEMATRAEEGQIPEVLVPPAEMVAHLPAFTVPEDQIPRLLHGGAIRASRRAPCAVRGAQPDNDTTAHRARRTAHASAASLGNGPVRLLDAGGELIAIGRCERKDGEGWYLPVKVLRNPIR